MPRTVAASGVKENILATLEVPSLKAVSLVLLSGKVCLQRFSRAEAGTACDTVPEGP